jgi:hypothetical protein
MASYGTAATHMELVGKSLSLLMDRSKKTTKAAIRDHIWGKRKSRVKNSCSLFLSTSDSNAHKGGHDYESCQGMVTMAPDKCDVP